MPHAPVNTPPLPTPIYRMVHIDNLPILLTRDALHAPRHAPQDGLPYSSIGVYDAAAERGVRDNLAVFANRHQPVVSIERSWYY